MSSTDNETLSWRNPGAEIATIDLEVYGFSGAENQYDMRITLDNCGEAPFYGMDDGELRLADGPDENSGRLEVFLNGEWGTICDDQFGQEDANVACRQLGFAGAERVSSFGAGEGLIHMDDVGCIGDEALIDCAHLDSDRQIVVISRTWWSVGGRTRGSTGLWRWRIDAGEECDDGNLNDGDGCSAECMNEVLAVVMMIWKRMTRQIRPPHCLKDLHGLNCAQDSDYYAVVVCAQGTLVANINFDDSEGDLDMELLSDGGAILDSSTSITDLERVRWSNFGDEATVYVGVYGFQRAENQYSLSIELEGCGPAENPI